jgi:5,5'-dehydrodivanillate O-demethylase
MAANQDYTDVAHIGPGTLAGTFIRRFWQPIARSMDLLPGRPQRVELLGEWWTVYRGETGQAHVVADRCPHRQTALSLGWVEGERIRCFYHGWMFDGATGQCVDQPAEKDNFKDKVTIRACPTREYLGLVFAYFGEGPAPEFPLFPEIEEAQGTLSVTRHIVPCNYFQRVENDLDETHVHFVHRVSTDSYGLNELPEIDVEESDYGILRRGGRRGGGANSTRTGHYLMPNTLLVDLPPAPEHKYWTLHLAWRVPLNDETMASHIVSLRQGAPSDGRISSGRVIDPDPLAVTEDVLASKIRVQDIDPSYIGLFQVQDNVALAGQGRIVDRSKDWLGQSDKGIILLRKLWARELEAIATGKPCKNWRRPKEKLPLLVNGVTEVSAL